MEATATEFNGTEVLPGPSLGSDEANLLLGWRVFDENKHLMKGSSFKPKARVLWNLKNSHIYSSVRSTNMSEQPKEKDLVASIIHYIALG